MAEPVHQESRLALALERLVPLAAFGADSRITKDQSYTARASCDIARGPLIIAPALEYGLGTRFGTYQQRWPVVVDGHTGVLEATWKHSNANHVFRSGFEVGWQQGPVAVRAQLLWGGHWARWFEGHTKKTGTWHTGLHVSLQPRHDFSIGVGLGLVTGQIDPVTTRNYTTLETSAGLALHW